MIMLIEGYVIKTDAMQWILCKEGIRIDKNTGEQEIVYNNVAYFSTLENALEEHINDSSKRRFLLAN